MHKIVFSGVMLMALFFSERTLGCDLFCEPIDEQISADVIFFGRLVFQEPDVPNPPWAALRRMDFEVLVGFKGVQSTRITLLTDTGGSFAGCGFYASLGEKVLVYAWLDEEAGGAVVSACSPRELNFGAASDEMSALRAMGFEPLELTDETDLQYFPGTNACGWGTPFAALASMCLLTCMRQQVRMPKRR